MRHEITKSHLSQVEAYNQSILTLVAHLQKGDDDALAQRRAISNIYCLCRAIEGEMALAKASFCPRQLARWNDALIIRKAA